MPQRRGAGALFAAFLFFFLIFLLGIFLIYISNAIPKVPHTPPHSPTHPLPLFGLGVPLYWCRVCSRPARTTQPPVILTAVYSANFSLHLSPPNPGPLTLIYSQPPSTHGRPHHLTRHAASANQGSRGMSPPNMDLFTPPASWCTCAALTMAVAYFQVYEEVRCKS